MSCGRADPSFAILMPAGKSSERLVEELSAFTPGRPPLFAETPIEVYKITSNALYQADFGGFCLPGLPLWPKVLNAFFPASRTHLQVESDRNLRVDSAGEVERDWQIADCSNDKSVVVLACTLTGAQVTINSFAAEIPVNIRLSFSFPALKTRMLKADPDMPEGNLPIADSWELFARIVSDLILTSPQDRRKINSEASKPSKLLELPLVLPFLGFQLESESKLYRPPLEASPEYLHWLRRILLEIKFETTSIGFRQPLHSAASQFLGCQAASGESFLSPAAYACLGAVSTSSDEKLLTRFELALQNDGLYGSPWYLEALKTVSQQAQSELLETRVIEHMSLGTPTLSSLDESLAKIGQTIESQASHSDEELLNLVLSVPLPDCVPLLTAICALRPTQTWQRASAAPSMNTEQALRVFAIDAIDESTIIERFNTVRSNGSGIDRLEANFALQTLAFAIRSSKLLALFETVAPQSLDSGPNYEEALALLGLSPEVTNQDAEAIFAVNADDVSNTKLLELRRALYVIAEERQSPELLSFLGFPEEIDLVSMSPESTPRSRLPVGLWNIGNTCYLNSLLQFYYSLSQVRNYIIDYKDPFVSTDQDGLGDSKSVDPDLAHVDSDEKLDRRGGSAQDAHSNQINSNNEVEAVEAGTIMDSAPETKTENITEADEESFYSSESLGVVDSYESLDDSDMDTKVEVQYIQDKPAAEELLKQRIEREVGQIKESKRIGGREVPPKQIRRCQIFVDRFGKLFQQMRDTPSAHVTPSEMLAYMALVPPQEDADDVIAAAGPNEESALRGRLIGAMQRQQDVTECIENVLDQLEATMPAIYADPDDGEQYDLIKQLFYGTTVQTLSRVSDGANRRTKTERYSSLLLDVSDGPTEIYESLDNYFGDDVLDLEDGKTLRTLRLTSVPEILQVQVQRVQFDKTTFMPYKNINPLIFSETVYLDRYLAAAEGSDLDLRTTKVKQWKEELAEVRASLEADKKIVLRKHALETTLAWLQQERRVSDATFDAVKKHHAELCDQVSRQEARLAELEHSIEHEFDDLHEYGYRIHSLFIHKGDASYGHYWIYIRDEETGEFCKFNDEIVTRVPNEEVFNFEPGNLATPYFLVFVRTPKSESTAGTQEPNGES